MTDNMLLQLRNTAKIETDQLVRFNLKLVADELDQSISRLFASPTTDNLITVNGHWAHAVRLLEFSKNGGGGKGGNGGRQEIVVAA